jgi:hypothetical protein
MDRDEVPGIWKQSFKEIKRLKKAIADIYELSSSIQTEGHEPEYLSRIHAICMDVLPKQDY